MKRAESAHMPDSAQAFYSFASDNTAGMCPEALDAFLRANEGYLPSYGDDEWTARASDTFRALFETDCDVYFTTTGTASNSLALASLCQSYHAVIAHELAHIETDECGAPEFYSNGSKILTAPGAEGKLRPGDLDRIVTRRLDIHYPRPRVLSLSQTTEAGTVYNAEEIASLCAAAKGHGLKIHMDGARFFNACAALDVSPATISWHQGVDVLCVSGAKNGLGLGEAVLFFDRSLSLEFASRCKQAGQLVSKMRFLSAPWLGLLENGAWLKHARHANCMAAELRAGMETIPGIRFGQATQANGVFAHVPSAALDILRGKGWRFYTFIGQGYARFMCSWKTSPGEVRHLLDDLRAAVEAV